MYEYLVRNGEIILKSEKLITHVNKPNECAEEEERETERDRGSKREREREGVRERGTL